MFPTKERFTRSNKKTLSKLWTQENKSSTLRNMISLNGVSWNPRYAPDVERPKLDGVLNNVKEKRDNTDLSQVLIYKKSHRINLCLLRPPKMDRKSSYKHRCTPLSGKTRKKSENKSMPLPAQTHQSLRIHLLPLIP